ncbi:hypothetical protein HDZ31DRAFT_61679 [Schizophyllum fasciatum]
MATATMDSFDAQMGDFSSDNDIQMNMSEPWLNDMPMDADDDDAVAHRDSTSQEIEMSDHVDDPAEFDMLDGEGRLEDVEPRDVEFEDASHSMTADPFHPEPAELEMSPPSEQTLADASQAALPDVTATYISPTVSSQPQDEPSSTPFPTTELEHPATVQHENEGSAPGAPHASDHFVSLGDAAHVYQRVERSNAPESTQPSGADTAVVEDVTPVVEGTIQQQATSEAAPEPAEPSSAVEHDLADSSEKPSTDGDYRPTILLSTPDPDCPQFYLFNSPPDVTDVPVLLGTRPPTCYWSPLSDLFGALRQQAFVQKLPDIDIAELTIEAYDIRLVIAETNSATSTCSLHDFDMIHSNEGVPGYLRLRLSAPVPFIERFSRLKAKFEASLNQMDGAGEQVEESYNESSNTEEHADYDNAPEEQEQHVTVSDPTPEVGLQEVPHEDDGKEPSAHAEPAAEGTSSFEGPAVSQEAPSVQAVPALDANEAHDTVDVLTTADPDNAATEFVDHADPYEEGDEGVEQQSYDEYVEQAEGGGDQQDGGVVDFTEEQGYGEEGYEEGAYEEKLDEKLYGDEHVAQETSQGVSGAPSHIDNSGYDENAGDEGASTSDQVPVEAVQEYQGDSLTADPNADAAQLPPLPEDDGDEDDSDLTAEGSTYQDPIVVQEPDVQPEGEGGEDQGEEYYEEGDTEEYEQYEEDVEGEGDFAQAEHAETEGVPADEGVAKAALEPAAEEPAEVGGENGEALEDGEADAEGEDDEDEAGNDTFGFAEYEPDTTADTTVDIDEQHEVASNISSTTLSSTSPMPPPKASFAEAMLEPSEETTLSKPLEPSVVRAAKTPLAKSSSKRSLREVEEDDEEGALSGQELSPGTKRARVEA